MPFILQCIQWRVEFLSVVLVDGVVRQVHEHVICLCGVVGFCGQADDAFVEEKKLQGVAAGD